MSGTLFVVATPIGNLEDISARALRVLREASVIAAEDTRRTAQLLARFAITTPTTSLHEHNEAEKAEALVARLRAGESVALVSDAGTPAISDPGERLVRHALDAGIRVESIPGPSAVVAALAASGFPASSYTFLGFPPTRSSDRKAWLEQLRSAGRTVVFFEAPHRILETLQDVQRVAGDVQVAISRELTKAHEELVRGPISIVIGAVRPQGEFTVVVNLCETTKLSGPASPASDLQIASEFGLLAKSSGGTKRSAVATLARRHGRPANEIYAALERAKKLVE